MHTKPDTLVILSPGFAANEADTTCLPAQQSLVRTINRNYPNYNIIILAFQYPYSNMRYQWQGATVIPFNGQNRGRWKRLKVWWRVWKELKRIKKEQSLAGVFSFWLTECGLVGTIFCRRHHIKHYSWILGQDAKKENKFVKWIRPHAPELVAMSDFLATEFSKNHSVRPQFIIPNGIDSTLYTSTPGKRDIDILGSGSLIPLKQYDLFIEVISVLKKQFPYLKAVLCGKGPEEERLKKMVARMNLEDTIFFVGEKGHNEVLQLMQRSKILLHTSRYEGFSSVCLEALYAGAHVISFCNPMNEWIRHWHIVETKEEMIARADELLQENEEDHQPVLPYPMQDTARSVMKLFFDEIPA